MDQKEESVELGERMNEKEAEIKLIYKELSIEILVNKVIREELGNGQERKNKLGELYPIVQN